MRVLQLDIFLAHIDWALVGNILYVIGSALWVIAPMSCYYEDQKGYADDWCSRFSFIAAVSYAIVGPAYMVSYYLCWKIEKIQGKDEQVVLWEKTSWVLRQKWAIYAMIFFWGGALGDLCTSIFAYFFPNYEYVGQISFASAGVCDTLDWYHEITLMRLTREEVQLTLSPYTMYLERKFKYERRGEQETGVPKKIQYLYDWHGLGLLCFIPGGLSYVLGSYVCYFLPDYYTLCDATQFIGGAGFLIDSFIQFGDIRRELFIRYQVLLMSESQQQHLASKTSNASTVELEIITEEGGITAKPAVSEHCVVVEEERKLARASTTNIIKNLKLKEKSIDPEAPTEEIILEEPKPAFKEKFSEFASASSSEDVEIENIEEEAFCSNKAHEQPESNSSESNQGKDSTDTVTLNGETTATHNGTTTETSNEENPETHVSNNHTVSEETTKNESDKENSSHHGYPETEMPYQQRYSDSNTPEPIQQQNHFETGTPETSYQHVDSGSAVSEKFYQHSDSEYGHDSYPNSNMTELHPQQNQDSVPDPTQSSGWVTEEYAELDLNE